MNKSMEEKYGKPLEGLSCNYIFGLLERLELKDIIGMESMMLHSENDIGIISLDTILLNRA